MTNIQISIRRLQASEEDFFSRLKQLLAWESLADDSVDETVKNILVDVQLRGDTALFEYTQKFDDLVLNASTVAVAKEKIQSALKSIDEDQRQALEIAAARIRAYHQHQVQVDWSYAEPDGTVLGQKITPLQRVGLYVPGGKAAYPSTLLMTAIPAKVAGVEEIVMVSPIPNGEMNNLVLAAAAIAGIDIIYTIGGAQAIAALAYGTETIAKVDKIVGPGNIYVAAAKRRVFGEVAIDMIAGPSEILVIADANSNPDWVAMDLLSQAEHDELAQSILISPDADFLDAVQESLNTLLPSLERCEIARRSLQDRGALIQVDSLEQAVEVANQIAPEHLELSVAQPEKLLPLIKHAGAIFMGAYTSEALGDYVAGPSHVLPTSTTARFSSPLGVYDFQKRSSVIHCSQAGAAQLGTVASVLARGESLTAHARAAEMRIPEPEDV